MKIPANTTATAVKAAPTTPIAPTTPEAGQNPVPATERDTPVLIQDTPPAAGQLQIAPAENTPNSAKKAPDTSETAKNVVEKTKELVNTVLDEVAKASTATAGKTTTIKVLKAHPALGSFAGDTTTVPTELAERLIESGHVVEVSADGKAVAPTYGQPTTAQLVAASAAYGRFIAAGGESEATEFMSPAFDELPTEYQRCFVAAIDPTYGPQA